MTGEEIVCAWIQSDACGVGLKMMLDRKSVQPLMEAIEAQFAALRREHDELRAALHDAIVRPSGVVPHSAQPFYRSSEAIRAEARRPVYGTCEDQQERAYIESAAARTLAETGR